MVTTKSLYCVEIISMGSLRSLLGVPRLSLFFYSKIYKGLVLAFKITCLFHNFAKLVLANYLDGVIIVWHRYTNRRRMENRFFYLILTGRSVFSIPRITWCPESQNGYLITYNFVSLQKHFLIFLSHSWNLPDKNCRYLTFVS